MRSIAIMNNKGGVGKTVTAINLADILVRDYHQRVVLVDCDGQANLTRFYLPAFDSAVNATTAEVLTGEAEPHMSDLLCEIIPGLSLLPASDRLYMLDVEAINAGQDRPDRLWQMAESAWDDGDTDWLIFDCPPGYTTASVGALLAAQEVVIPTTVDGFSFTGMSGLLRQIATMRSANAEISVAGVLITQWRNTPVVQEGEKALRELEVPVFQTVIRRTDKVPESTIAREPLAVYSPKSAAGMDYRAWGRELMGEEAAGSGQGKV